MTGDDRSRLRSVFERFAGNPDEVDAVFAGAPILDTLTIDSLALIHLVAELEREFSARFDYASIDRAFTDIDSLEAHLRGERRRTP
jgi:acyl carrier protein